eukprot:jgi/Ulvmu1/4561/UM002_0289.1
MAVCAIGVRRSARTFLSCRGDYIAVVEEQDLPAMLELLAQSTDNQGSEIRNIPRSIITLPAPEDQAFMPGPKNPLLEYLATTNDNFTVKQEWNPQGKELIDLNIPCGVFLSPAGRADEYRVQSQQNNRRGFKGATFGASIDLSTQMTADSDSLSCISAKQCLPLGGYSVWAAMPPSALPRNPPAPPRQQIVVMAHWDSRSLFRCMASGTHGALSGLIAMLVAMDILSQGRGLNFSRDLVFVSLTGEAHDLLGSRQLLFNLDSPGGPHNASVAGLRRDDIAALIEVGMLGYDPNVFNGTWFPDRVPGPVEFPRGGEVFMHHAGGDALGMNAAFVASANFKDAPRVSNSSRDVLPPSSLLAWRAVMPDVDAVYVGDFDDRFHEESYWSYKDLGLRQWSRHAVARAAILLARSLHQLASGTPLDVSEISIKAVTDMTDELFECLSKPGGLRCGLVRAMTGSHSLTSAEQDTAEQYVGVLRELPPDDQSRNATYKKNIERFVWEFLANRTYSGAPHDVPDKDGVLVGCDSLINRCPENEVCLHVSGDGGDQGRCVRADVKYTPAYPTTLTFQQCAADNGDDCTRVWQLADSEGNERDPAAWATSHGLPEDPVWTETFNEVVRVTVTMRERPLHDAVLLMSGILSTAVVACVVIGIKALHKRQKQD